MRASQSTESVKRDDQATPTYVRTYGRTKNLQDQADRLPFHNAHEKGARR